MPTVKEVFARLIRNDIVDQQFLGQRVGFDVAINDEVYGIYAKQQTVLSFSLEAYERFHSALQALNVALPEEVQSKLPPITSLATQAGRQPKFTAASAAFRLGARVIVPFRIIRNLSEWFNNKRGRQGLSARNAIERLMFSERIETTQPESRRATPKPGRTPEPEVPGPLQGLERRFDVELVPPYGIMGAPDMRGSIIDGTTLVELGVTVSGTKPLLYVIEDDEHFHAILVGPALGAWQEAATAKSSIGFKLATVPHRQLRQESYVSDLLLRGDAFGEGIAYVTDRAGKPIATLVSVALFLKLMGIPT